MLFRAGTRGTSMGARVIIFNAEGAVYLVRHSYVAGWFFPGGGVDRHEIPIEAAKREMREEARMIANEAPKLHGIVRYEMGGVPDYVFYYIVRDWTWDTPSGTQPTAPSDDGEIVEARFFPIDALPDGINGSTQKRITEIVVGLEPPLI